MKNPKSDYWQVTAKLVFGKREISQYWGDTHQDVIKSRVLLAFIEENNEIAYGIMDLTVF